MMIATLMLMLNNIFIFGAALFLVINGATMATKFSTRLAESFHLSRYVVGFIIVAVISILPETFVAINASIAGVPAFGLATLFGSNVADLTLLFAIIVFVIGRGLKVEAKIIRSHVAYPFLLLLPLILGSNGHFSRPEGAALLVAGAVFYYLALRNNPGRSTASQTGRSKLGNFLLLLLSMALLLVGAHFTVTSATDIAYDLGISSVLVGMLIVGLGTTMPELFFALKSAQKKDDSLAVGDILGTVLADATMVVGILALLNPFYFPVKIIYVTGVFMLAGALLLFYCMATGRAISRREAGWLLVFWLTFAVVEFLVNR